MTGEPQVSQPPEGTHRRSAHPWDWRLPLILVPLDGSAEAKAALPAARLIASIAQATIHVVHASDHPLSKDELLQRMGLKPEEIRGMVIDCAVGDTAADALVRFAAEMRAMLIVMTTRGRTAYLGRTVRPVVERIVQEAPCPVLLVRPEIERRLATMTGLRRILLPLDGAPSSASVIGPALDLARRTGAQVDILYVATQARCPKEPGTLTGPRYVDQVQHEWASWSREFLSRFGTALGKFAPPTPTHLFVRRGEPAAETLCLAAERDSDLIVLEWRGKLDPAHARVVRGVLRDAPCPVLLLRTAPVAEPGGASYR